jgi:coenzyme F420-0:L-glutamate ligase/coenzyme F420-1:gamma-L-glutamate ligase
MKQPAQDFLRFLAGRRSVRRFKSGGLDPALLHAIIEAARWAPSAHNRQPWRLVVVQDPVAKLGLAEAMADRLRRERTADGDDKDDIEADAKKSVEKLRQAAALIVVFITMEGMDHYADQRRMALEHLMAVQSTAMAGQNMLLMAHKLEIGACWVCAPLFADQEAVEAMNCPVDWEPQGLIMLGWPENTPPVRQRKPLEEVSRWI